MRPCWPYRRRSGRMKPLFIEGWRGFVGRLSPRQRKTLAARRIARAARSPVAGTRALPSSKSMPPTKARATSWDLARVRRRLERSLVQTGLLVRRARWLCSARRRDRRLPRARHAERARARDRRAATSSSATSSRASLSVAGLPARRPQTYGACARCSFDAAVYDRLACAGDRDPPRARRRRRGRGAHRRTHVRGRAPGEPHR